MMYSTLKEVYNVDSFEKSAEKEKKHKKKNKNKDDSEETDTKDLYIEPVPTQCTPPPSRKISMNDVKPYLDADLEQYLNYVSQQQTLNQPVVTPNTQATTNSSTVTSATTATTATELVPTVEPVVEPSRNTDKKDIFYKNLINIGLFVFIGILVIFLCDQITEIAVNLGMKKTVELLKPYLARLDKLDKS
jgi:ABC-type antimicrobial peptide transport system permease subunit